MSVRLVLGILFIALLAWIMFVPGPVFGASVEHCSKYERQGYDFFSNSTWDSNVTILPPDRDGDRARIGLLDEGENRNMYCIRRSDATGACELKCRK
ncbi:MAG: hypothetical protein O2794_03450 [bacterium]|nr:hypothetical protein [bacterium]